MYHQTIELLNIKLKSALKHKLQNDKLEHKLRSTHRILSEEITVLKTEIEFLLEQLSELTKNLSEMKCHVANIEICHVSEQHKIKKQVENLNDHSDGYKNLSAQEENVLRQRQDKLKAEDSEVGNLKKKQLEINEIQEKKALEMDIESEIIESECNVLKKRNKAIMLKLRRKLLETDEIRRNLVKNKNTPTH